MVIIQRRALWFVRKANLVPSVQSLKVKIAQKTA